MIVKIMLYGSQEISNVIKVIKIISIIFTRVFLCIKYNGILCLETVRKSRLPNNTIPDENNLKVDPREKFYEYVSIYEIILIFVTSQLIIGIV